MDFKKESYLMEYRQRAFLAELETRRQIKEAMAAATPRESHILFKANQFLQALAHVRKIRIEIHFDYNEPQPKATSC